MSIANYTELKAAVASWGHRTDLTAQIPDFIKLAESRINRLTGPIQNREFEVDLTATVGSRDIAMPPGVKEANKLWLTTYLPREVITYRNPEDLPEQISSGPPSYWTVIGGDTIRLDSEADIAHTFKFFYRGKFTLSDSSPTNWLLTNFPDIYLYGALMELGAYVKDYEQVSIWKQAYDLAVSQLMVIESRTKANTTLRTELSGVGRSNILEDR